MNDIVNQHTSGRALCEEMLTTLVTLTANLTAKRA
jgi:hypothetical protein